MSRKLVGAEQRLACHHWYFFLSSTDWLIQRYRYFTVRFQCSARGRDNSNRDSFFFLPGSDFFQNFSFGAEIFNSGALTMPLFQLFLLESASQKGPNPNRTGRGLDISNPCSPLIVSTDHSLLQPLLCGWLSSWKKYTARGHRRHRCPQVETSVPHG